VRQLQRVQWVTGSRTFGLFSARCASAFWINDFDPTNLGAFIWQSFLLVLR